MSNNEHRFTDSVEEHAAQILSRFSVFDLREISGEEMERAEARYLRSEGFIGIVYSGERNMIRWFIVSSSGRWSVGSGQKEQESKTYEVRRFETFWFCSCAGFTLSRTCCKHIAFIQHSQKGKGKSYDNSSIGKAAAIGHRDRSHQRPENVYRPAA